MLTLPQSKQRHLTGNRYGVAHPGKVVHKCVTEAIRPLAMTALVKVGWDSGY
jgi:hypothetical protein